MTVRAILFDLGDTLFGLDPLPADLAGLIADCLVANGAAEPAAAAGVARRGLAALRDEVMASFAAGHLSEPDMADLSRRHFSIAGALVADTIAMELGDVFGRADIARFRPTEDAASRVEMFRRAGYRLAAVSNTTTRPALLEAFLAEVGLLPLFETVVFSCAVGVRKPHPDIFGAALTALDVAARDVVFVGDRVREDVRGPQSLGMRAVLTHEFRQEDPADSGPLAMVGRLDELHAVLGTA